MKCTQMVTFMKEIMRMENHMEEEYIDGLMMNHMKVSGIKDSSMDMASGKELMEIPILVSGKIQKLMVMEFIYGKMEIVMKENGGHVLNMEKDLIYFQMAMYILDIIRMVSLKTMASIYGLMALFMMATSKLD
jgi:hypothetical protein